MDSKHLSVSPPIHFTPNYEKSLWNNRQETDHEENNQIMVLESPIKCQGHANRRSSTPSTSRRRSPSSDPFRPTAFLYKGQSAQLATSNDGMYGEMVESLLKSVATYLKNECYSDEFSVFCDLGSGRGTPSTIVAYEGSWLASIGVEKCPQAYMHSVLTMKTLVKRRLRNIHQSPYIKEEIPESPINKINYADVFVAFANEDISIYDNYDGVSHLYSFDAAMESALVNNIVHQFMRTETAYIYVSFRSDLIQTFELKDCKIIHKICSNMYISGEGRTCYVYRKDNWKDCKMKHRYWLVKKFLPSYLEFKENTVYDKTDSKENFETADTNENENCDSNNFTDKFLRYSIKNYSGPSQKCSIRLSKWKEPMRILDLILLARAPPLILLGWYVEGSIIQGSVTGLQNKKPLTRSQKQSASLDIKGRRAECMLRDALIDKCAQHTDISQADNVRNKLRKLVDIQYMRNQADLCVTNDTYRILNISQKDSIPISRCYIFPRITTNNPVWDTHSTLTSSDSEEIVDDLPSSTNKMITHAYETRSSNYPAYHSIRTATPTKKNSDPDCINITNSTKISRPEVRKMATSSVPRKKRLTGRSLAHSQDTSVVADENFWPSIDEGTNLLFL